MSTIQLTIPDDLRKRLESRLASGDFEDPEEYVLALLRYDLEPQSDPAVEALLIQRNAAPRHEMTAETFDRIRARVAERVHPDKR